MTKSVFHDFAEARLARLLEARQITVEQVEKFRVQGVSEIVAATDPRAHPGGVPSTRMVMAKA